MWAKYCAAPIILLFSICLNIKHRQPCNQGDLNVEYINVPYIFLPLIKLASARGWLWDECSSLNMEGQYFRGVVSTCNGILKPGRRDPAGETGRKRMERQTGPAGHHSNLGLNTTERQGTITSAQRLLELTLPLLISPFIFFVSLSLLRAVVLLTKHVKANQPNSSLSSLATGFRLCMVTFFVLISWLSISKCFFLSWPGYVKCRCLWLLYLVLCLCHYHSQVTTVCEVLSRKPSYIHKCHMVAKHLMHIMYPPSSLVRSTNIFLKCIKMEAQQIPF